MPCVAWPQIAVQRFVRAATSWRISEMRHAIRYFAHASAITLIRDIYALYAHHDAFADICARHFHADMPMPDVAHCLIRDARRLLSRVASRCTAVLPLFFFFCPRLPGARHDAVCQFGAIPFAMIFGSTATPSSAALCASRSAVAAVFLSMPATRRRPSTDLRIRLLTVLFECDARRERATQRMLWISAAETIQHRPPSSPCVSRAALQPLHAKYRRAECV